VTQYKVKIEETIILKYTFDSANFEIIQKFPCAVNGISDRNLNISVTVRFDFDIQF